MELIANHQVQDMIEDTTNLVQKSSGKFIEANTTEVSLNHLKNDCIIPVFRDNETTISHFEFIDAAKEIAESVFNGRLTIPSIRVSHQIKGRIPSAIHKTAKDLLEHEKTRFYERMAFMIEIPNKQIVVNNQTLNLSIGGVRAYNQQNLFSKKSIEKFKVFIGYKNTVCTNLCIATDGLQSEIRVSSITELQECIYNLIQGYNQEAHIGVMERMSKFQLSEQEFAHLLGKMRMYHFLSKEERKTKFPLQLTDSQIGIITKNYFTDKNFKRASNKMINLWQVYNLFTEANKSSYIDTNLERNVSAYEFIQMLGFYRENKQNNFFNHIII